MSDEFFFTNGPIFIFLSDENFLNGTALNDSMVVELARDLRGYMFSIEYRYSGQSFPVKYVLTNTHPCITRKLTNFTIIIF